jgi:predicted Zn-dependent protease with MMP-like domain
MVEDELSPDPLKGGGKSPGSTVLGLNEGRPLRYRSVSESFHLPDQITIFQQRLWPH